MHFNYIVVNTNLWGKKLINYKNENISKATKRKKQKNTIFEKYADS